MPNIVVASIRDAEQFAHPEKWAAISIVSPRMGTLETYPALWPTLSEENRIGLLQLAFHDIDRFVDGMQRFTADDGEKILAFVDEVWNNIDCLLVHCEAGISRSAGVAAAVSRIKIGHDGGFFNTHIPNRFIYKNLLKLNENRKRT